MKLRLSTLLTFLVFSTSMAPLSALRADASYVAQSGPTGEIAFVKEADVWLLNMANGEVRKVTNDGSVYGGFTWTPDGERVTFSSRREGESRIFSVNPDGSSRTQLTNGPGDDQHPAYSPDGTIFFTRDKPTDTSTEHQVVRRGASGEESVIYSEVTSICNSNGLSISADGRFALSYWCGRHSSVIVGSTDPGGESSGLSPAGVDCPREARWAHTTPVLAFLSNNCDAEETNISVHVADLPIGMAVIEQRMGTVSRGGGVGWSPDDRFLIISGSEGLVTLDTQSGEMQQVYSEGDMPVWRPGERAKPTPTPVPVPPTSTKIPPTATSAPPTATAIPMADPQEARRWLGEKERLITELRSVNIPIDLFDISLSAPAYNEDKAEIVVNRVRDLLVQGKLTPEQLEAFARLTLQERMFADILPTYTTVAGTIAKTGAETVQTVLGGIEALRPGWAVCDKLVFFCGDLQKHAEKTAWRLVNNTGKAFAHWSGASSEKRKAYGDAWGLIVKLVEQKLGKGDSLVDIVKDAAIAVGGTTLIIQPYLRSTQALMDKGVRSADPDLMGGDRWEITGSSQRVEVMLGDTGAKAQADIQAQDAKQRVEEFERGTDILKYAEDVTALVGLPGKAEELVHLSPHGWMLKAVQLGTRAEHIAINAVLLINNRKNLECVEYLSKAGGEAAFEVRALETCDQRKKSLNKNEREEGIVGAPFLAAPVHSPLHAMLQEDTNAYKEAVSDLLALMEKEDADSDAIKKALDRVSAAEGEVAGALESMQAIVLEHETLSDADLELLQKNAAFAGKNYTLYLSVADKLMAVKAGEIPETDLPKAGTEAIQEAENATRVASKVDVSVPEIRPILVIQNAKVERLGESQLRVTFGVRNVGSGTANDVKVQANEGNEQANGAEGVGTILPNAEQQVTLTVPLPGGDAITLQAWVGDSRLDSRQEPVPSVAKAITEPVVQTQSGSSTAMWIVIGIMVGALALGLVAFALMRRSTKRRSL